MVRPNGMDGSKRRGIRPIAWCCLLATLAACPPDRHERAHARLPRLGQARRLPNLLIMVGDDHAAGKLGIDGDPRKATPRLDRLAKQGVRFDRAFCNAPLCSPSRQSFITGRLPHAVGVTRLTTPMPDDALTLGHWLGDLGYETAAYGKMHFNSRSGGDNHHGFNDRVDTDDWSRWLAANPPAGGDRRTKWRPFRSPPETWLDAETQPFGLPDEAMESSFYVRRAEAVFKNHQARKGGPLPSPFALLIGFDNPHAPFKFPDDWPSENRYRADQFPDQPLTDFDRSQQPRLFAGLTPVQKRGIAASYYTSLAHLDRQVGRVLDALDASGLAEETVVVYLGDNGYLLGEHGRFEKHCLYEQAVRVPLILRWPGHLPDGRQVLDLVELVDLVPTLCDLLGLPLPPNLHGRSVKGLAEGRAGARGREVVVSEYLENEEAMARSDRYKLVVAAGGRKRGDGYAAVAPTLGPSERLYDLLDDPGETVNQINRPELASVVEGLRRKLLDRLRTTRELRTPVPSHLTEAEALRWCLTPQD